MIYSQNGVSYIGKVKNRTNRDLKIFETLKTVFRHLMCHSFSQSNSRFLCALILHSNLRPCVKGLVQWFSTTGPGTKGLASAPRKYRS